MMVLKSFMGAEINQNYEFGRFVLKTSDRVLLRDSEPVALTPKTFDILVALVESGGQLVNKDDLMKRVWPNTFVEEGNLTQNVSLLRKALGDGVNGSQFIETVPRRGYRFVAPLKVAEGGNGHATAGSNRTAHSVATTTISSSQRVSLPLLRNRVALVTAAAVAVIVIAAVITYFSSKGRASATTSTP